MIHLSLGLGNLREDIHSFVNFASLPVRTARCVAISMKGAGSIRDAHGRTQIVDLSLEGGIFRLCELGLFY